MALQWLWDEKCGELIIEQTIDNEVREFTMSLYEGNAFLIMLHEFTDDDGKSVYRMWSFFVDKNHAKRCLGLQKNADGEKRNLFVGGFDTIKKLRINKAKSRNYKDIVSMFAQAFDTIVIEIVSEK